MISPSENFTDAARADIPFRYKALIYNKYRVLARLLHDNHELLRTFEEGDRQMLVSQQRLGFAALTLTGALALGIPAANADLILDPLHGFCNGGGAGNCVDNGTNTPLGGSTTFGFSISPGGQTGTLSLVFLVPNNESPALAPGPVTGTGGTGNPPTLTAPITAVSGTWTSGTLADFLSVQFPNGAAPNNPIGAYLPTTQSLDPGATGYDVFIATFSTALLLQGNSTENSGPIFNVPAAYISDTLGGYIVGFCQNDASSAPGDCLEGGKKMEAVATANSGALLDNQNHFVPEPASLAIFGTALAGMGLLGRRRRRKNV